LEDMLLVWGDRPIALGRELTKIHEELVVLPISAILSRGIVERGEFVIVVSGFRPSGVDSKNVDSGAIAREFGLMTNSGQSRRGAIRTLAHTHGVSARAIFSLLELAKNSVE